MILASFMTAAPLLLVFASADLDRDTEDQFEKIADSVAMAQTCRQHDFDVDDAGLSNWSESAVDQAVLTGVERAEAQAMLDEEIAREYAQVQELFANAQNMSHSRDHVTRFNRRMKRTCERLSRDDLAGAYFTESDD